jgi:hypothetical protein
MLQTLTKLVGYVVIVYISPRYFKDNPQFIQPLRDVPDAITFQAKGTHGLGLPVMT